MLASVTPAGQDRQHVELDLKDARISLPFVGWEKGPGVPATASFVMAKNGGGSEVSNLQLSGKGFEARGTLLFGADRRLKTMDLEQLALRPGDQLSVSVVADDRGYDAKVRGAKLDARGIIKGIRAAAAGGAVDIFPIAISLDLNSVTGANDVSLSDVTGTMTVMKKGLDKIALKGRSGSDQPFEWTLGHDGGTRTLRFVAEGGGALIRFADIYTRISGGNLILDYSGPVGGVGNGVLVCATSACLARRH